MPNAGIYARTGRRHQRLADRPDDERGGGECEYFLRRSPKDSSFITILVILEYGCYFKTMSRDPLCDSASAD